MNIFLIRGLIREPAHWSIFPEILQQTLPDCKICYLTPAGVGERFREQSPTSIQAIVDDMRSQFLEQKGEHNYLISISLGGMITSQWIHDYPDDFQKVIIMNSSFKNLSHLYERVQPKSILRFLKIALTKSLEKKEELILNMVCNNEKVRSRLLKEWIEIAKTRPVSTANGLRQLWAAAKFSTSVKPPKSKCLLLASKEDKLCHYRCSEKLASVWNCPIHYHESAGHGLSEDYPEWVANQAKDFFLA